MCVYQGCTTLLSLGLVSVSTMSLICVRHGVKCYRIQATVSHPLSCHLCTRWFSKVTVGRFGHLFERNTMHILGELEFLATLRVWWPYSKRSWSHEYVQCNVVTSFHANVARAWLELCLMWPLHPIPKYILNTSNSSFLGLFMSILLVVDKKWSLVCLQRGVMHSEDNLAGGICQHRGILVSCVPITRTQ